jgi:hypothetical protein
MAIYTVSEALAAENAGRVWTGYARKVGPSLLAGVYSDMGYSSGLPTANYYASTPYVGAVLNSIDGFDIGPQPAAGMTKYLSCVTANVANGLGMPSFEFVDTVMYYPFVDGDGGYQEMLNPTPIPRYGGEGCRIAVISQGLGLGTVDVTIRYINCADQEKTVTTTLNLAVNAGVLCSSSPPAVSGSNVCNPYTVLAAGCKGVKRILSVDYLSPGGGIQAWLIVKPLTNIACASASLCVVEVSLMDERSFKLVPLPDGAFVNCFCLVGVAGTNNPTLFLVKTIWG